MPKPVGTRHSSGAKKFPNGWFIEREVRRGGRVYRQWFRTRDPNAVSAPRARRASATAAQPSARLGELPAAPKPSAKLQAFANKVGLSHAATRSLATLPASLRRDAKEDLLAIHRQQQATLSARAKSTGRRRTRKKGGNDAEVVTSRNLSQHMRALGVHVEAGDPTHVDRVLSNAFGGKQVTVGDMRKMMGLDAFEKHGLTPVPGHEPTLKFGQLNGGNMLFSAVYQNKAGETADIARGYQTENGKPYVYHDHFFISSGLQGGGLGRDVLKGQLATYKKLDLPEVRVYAAEVGRYYWRKIGFERSSAAEFESDKLNARQWLMGKGVGRDVAQRVMDQIKTSRQLATFELGGKKLGKEWALNESYGGHFKLDLKGQGWTTAKEEFGLTD